MEYTYHRGGTDSYMVHCCKQRRGTMNVHRTMAPWRSLYCGQRGHAPSWYLARLGPTMAWLSNICCKASVSKLRPPRDKIRWKTAVQKSNTATNALTLFSVNTKILSLNSNTIIIKCKEKNSSLKLDGRSAGQEFPNILLNHKFHYHVNKSPLMVPTMMQLTLI